MDRRTDGQQTDEQGRLQYPLPFIKKRLGIISCTEKLLVPPMFFNLYTKSPYNSGCDFKTDLLLK